MAIVKKVIDIIVNFVKDYWWIILIVAAIYFAPAIATWLTSVNAPTWMVSIFEGVSFLTPGLTSAFSSVTSGISSLWASGMEAFGGLSLGTKAALLTGVAMALAPEETTALLDATGEVIADTTTGIMGLVGSTATGILSNLAENPIAIIGLGFAVWWFFLRSDSEDFSSGGNRSRKYDDLSEDESGGDSSADASEFSSSTPRYLTDLRDLREQTNVVASVDSRLKALP